MSALAPTAPVWSRLDLVREVVPVDATADELAAKIRPDCYPILLPLMEEHARAAPVHLANLTPDAGLIDLLADKGLFAAYLLQRNLAAFAPKLYQSHEDIDYPCIVKRTDLAGGLGVDQVRDRKELDQLVDAKSLHQEKFIIQAWVGGTDEYVTHAVLRDGEIVWDKTFRYDLGQDNVLRTAQVTSDYRIMRTPTPTSLRDLLAAIAADLGLSGPVNVDYKIVDGRPVIFEINPRLGGSLMRPENVDLLAEALKAVVDGAVASDRFFAGVIRSSNLFDAGFYTNSENEFDHPVNDPALHYFRGGFQEGRDPSEAFSTNDYIALNLAAESAGINPLVHFELVGRSRQLPVSCRDRRLLQSALTTLNDPSRGDAFITVNLADEPVISDPLFRFDLLSWHRRPLVRRREPRLPRSISRALGGLFRGGAAADRRRFARELAKRPRSGEARVSKLTSVEAQRIIEERKLKTVKDSWHYSWDLERFFPALYLYETHSHSYLFHDRAIPYISAPAPLFSDDPALTRVIAHKGRFFPFWFLRYGSFDAFLDRRSLVSGNPNGNFPTRQTYKRLNRRKGGQIQRLPLLANRELFIEQFSRWKAEKFHFDGAQCLGFYLSVNPNVPPEWFHFYLLRDSATGNGRGVTLTIEDGRSAALLNIANERGYGLIMIVEAFRLMADLRYSSVNAGVSGRCGHYKDVLFLDTIEADATGLPPIGRDLD